ncbi:MAG: hypothetical protein ACOYNZ_02065 [Rhodoferax sp.]
MATKTLTPCSRERHTLALDVAGEIEASVNMLIREMQANSDAHSFDLILNTTLRRIRAVNSVSISVLSGDDDRTTEEMQEVVHGQVLTMAS